MEIAMTDGIIGNCVVCNQKIKKEKMTAKRIDDLWVCGLGCRNKFLKEKRRWIPKNWVELCKMQAIYEERKRTDIESLLRKNPIKKAATKLGSSSTNRAIT